MSTDEGLAAWLRKAVEARLALAREAGGVAWLLRDHPSETVTVRDEFGLTVIYDEGPPDHDQAAHIVANDPRSTIAQCESELAILDELAAAKARRDAERDDYDRWVRGEISGARPQSEGPSPVVIPGLERAVRFLAAGYRHHAPGWREEWVIPG